MLSPTLDTVRLFLHVLAASVWVGGQIALAGVVPTVRGAAPSATRPVARAFAKVAWPAFAVAFVTGLWNLFETDIGKTTTDYQITLLIKVTLAVVSAAAAAVHAIGRSKAALAIGGALGLLAGLGAMFVGLLLRTGS